MIIHRPDDVVNPEALEREDHTGEACPLDLWHRVVKHTLLPECIAVDAEALPSRGSSSAARSLLGLTSVDEREGQAQTSLANGS